MPTVTSNPSSAVTVRVSSSASITDSSTSINTAEISIVSGSAPSTLSRSAIGFSTTGASFTDVTVRVNTVVSVKVFDS